MNIYRLFDVVNGVTEKFGVKLNKVPPFVRTSDSDRKIYEAVKPHTMTSRARVLELIEATRYVVRHRIPGDFVECGVWQGGSVMTILLTLVELGVKDREVWLYDTFEGMSQATVHDGEEIQRECAKMAEGSGSTWCRSGLDEVRANVMTCGYPMDRIHFVKGKVEDTIPGTCPAGICLLRLDTDWYESTKHELIHMYSRLPSGGALIIDDYGTWQGAHKAVDEYFTNLGTRYYLHRIDEAGRILIKP